MPFRILSIDGGGLRGSIPLMILEHFSKYTGNKPITDCFDLIAGTSTGGIIACALSLKVSDAFKFKLEEIKELYTQHGSDIFPQHLFCNLKNLFRPKYNVSGLEDTLKRYFGDSTLRDCKIPVLVSAYDVKNYKTFYYSSRFVNPASAGSAGGKQFQLVDICRSTSAAPTYFPSHYLSFLDTQHQAIFTHNLVDGGVFVNNPSLAAHCEVIAYANDPLYQNLNGGKSVALPDIYIMSLGTGITEKTITKKQGATWGKVKWAPQLFDLMIQGNFQSVHHQMSVLFPEDHYVRLNVLLPPQAAELDDSSEKTRLLITEAVNKQIVNDTVTSDRMSQFVRDTGLAIR